MKKQIKDVLNLTRTTSPVTPYYLAKVNKAKELVQKYINKPSFIDKIK